MKKILNGMFLFVALFATINVQAQSCDITKTNGGGFTTTIQSVVDNCDNTYTIVLRIDHNGCGGPTCQELSHYSVQATPGTYSNVSVQRLSGGMTYGSIDMGPNLESDPFQGFKIDETEGIGDGQAGSFTITYTLSGAFQNQQTSAKAGTSAQLASFTAAQFEYVMNCNNAVCGGGNNDTDGDGCDDTEDEFPTDPARCYTIKYPASGFASLAWEDLWPGKGDYDLNDLVLPYKTTLVANADNNIVEVKSKFYIKAVGASLHNGFGWQFDNLTPAQIASVTGASLQKGYISLNANGTEANQAKAVIVVFDDADNILNRAGGSFFNTLPNGMVGTSDTLNITVTFTQPVAQALVGAAPFNPFLIKNGDRGKEIHLVDYVPTSLADLSILGTVQDDSNPATGRYYRTENNLPWAINIPEVLEHMEEYIEITEGYLHFSEWAESNGVSYPDWYMDKPGYRDASKLWQP